MATNYNSYSNFYHKKGMKDFGYPAGVLPIDLQNDKRLYGRVDRSQDAVLLTEKNISVGNMVGFSNMCGILCVLFCCVGIM